MKTLTLILAAVVLAGCSVTKYSRIETGGEAVTFSATSFGTKKTWSDLNFQIGTNHTRTFQLKGYQNDQVQAIGVAVEAAVKAAVIAVKP